MDLKDIIIACLIILIIGTVLFGSLGSFLGHIHKFVGNVADGAADDESFTVEFLQKNSPSISESGVSEKEISKSDNTQGEYNPGNGNFKYEDYQHDYLTDKVDSEGNPIYRSIVSTNGGQIDPGIYEVYWSKLGVISHTRIK